MFYFASNFTRSVNCIGLASVIVGFLFCYAILKCWTWQS